MGVCVCVRACVFVLNHFISDYYVYLCVYIWAHETAVSIETGKVFFYEKYHKKIEHQLGLLVGWPAAFSDHHCRTRLLSLRRRKAE